jgi:hypothetical protein
MIGPHGENLIFVISPPRAGSTLLQRILAGNGDVFATAEPWIMLHPLFALRNSGHTAAYNSEWAHAALADFCDNLAGGSDAYLRALGGMARELYNNALQPSGRRCFLDKTPRYYFILPELLRTFPEARFVFLLRHPLAVLSSVLTSWIHDGWPRLDNYACDLLEAPRLLARGLDHFGERAIVVRYETLVEQPEVTVRGLCEKLNLSFDSRMLEYGGREKPRGRMGDDAGIHRHSRPVTDSRDKWKSALSQPREHYFTGRYVEYLDDEICARLGYPKFRLFADWNALAAKQTVVQPEWQEHADRFFPPVKAALASAPGGSNVAPPKNVALACLEQAHALARRGELSVARDYIERALDLAPDDKTLQALWGRVRGCDDALRKELLTS